MTTEERDIARLESRIDELQKAFLGVVLKCDDVHHAKKDRHDTYDQCPVVKRLEALLDKPIRDENWQVIP